MVQNLKARFFQFYVNENLMTNSRSLVFERNFASIFCVVFQVFL